MRAETCNSDIEARCMDDMEQTNDKNSTIPAVCKTCSYITQVRS